MRSVFAIVPLVEGQRTYMPGDRIESGELHRLADYYAGLGQVRIVEAETIADDKPKRNTRKKAAE